MQRAGCGFIYGLFDGRDGDFPLPISFSRQGCWRASGFAFAGGIEKRILRRFGFSDLDCTAADVEGPTGVTGDGGDLSAGELDGVRVDDVGGDERKAGLDDELELFVGVAWEGYACEAFK